MQGGSRTSLDVHVFYPLMPKGVEHPKTGHPGPYPRDVFYPLMPKGVEHQEAADILDFFFGVFYPLMPKGVEHLLLNASADCWKSKCFIR